MHQACRAGPGLAPLPHFVARTDAALLHLARVPCPVARTVWLAVHPDVRRSPRVKAAADLIGELIRGNAPRLAWRFSFFVASVTGAAPRLFLVQLRLNL